MSSHFTTAVIAGGPLQLVTLALLAAVLVGAIVYLKLGNRANTQTAHRLAQTLGLTYAHATTNTLPETAQNFKLLTHGRSHRIGHVMISRHPAGPTVFALSHDAGSHHAPERYRQVVVVLPGPIGVPATLILSKRGPQDIAAELGYQDSQVVERTVRSKNLILITPKIKNIATLLAAHPTWTLELNNDQTAITTPGELTGDKAIDTAAFIADAKKLVAALS
ncbi:MAG: hypothetical protein V3V20_12715 [Algisphaera sp.]